MPTAPVRQVAVGIISPGGRRRRLQEECHLLFLIVTASARPGNAADGAAASICYPSPGRALADWMAGQQTASAPLRGYQWKLLFLPEGTHLRMRCDENTHFAEIQGDQLIFNGRAMSPSQMARAVAGDGRNAWRDLWVRFPGQRQWQPADRLRRELASKPAAQPSPMEAMQAAAHSMSAALRSALVLVNHASLSAQNRVERRLPRHRRCVDTLSDD